jgi:hypothetical protein
VVSWGAPPPVSRAQEVGNAAKGTERRHHSTPKRGRCFQRQAYSKRGLVVETYTWKRYAAKRTKLGLKQQESSRCSPLNLKNLNIRQSSLCRMCRVRANQCDSVIINTVAPSPLRGSILHGEDIAFYSGRVLTTYIVIQYIVQYTYSIQAEQDMNAWYRRAPTRTNLYSPISTYLYLYVAR